ncbi:MAG: hypothetical protein GDA48_13760 [Hormoscilla sp. GM102CHS1]|nr:hypothetical protein [Hormoscilla sp. GM102CHS1]
MYVENQKFIHTYYRESVSYASLEYSYFLQRFIGAKIIVTWK